MLKNLKQGCENMWNTIWRLISKNTYRDVEEFIKNSNIFQLDVRTGRDAKIHLRRKHFGPIVKKVVNDIMSSYRDVYTVDKVKYRFIGMDIFISRK